MSSTEFEVIDLTHLAAELSPPCECNCHEALGTERPAAEWIIRFKQPSLCSHVTRLLLLMCAGCKDKLMLVAQIRCSQCSVIGTFSEWVESVERI